jgi:hypothetical protein
MYPSRTIDVENDEKTAVLCYTTAMYERVIREGPESPVENGEFVRGTWSRAFRDVDLLDIRRPYRWLLPGWAREGRLKEWESFVIQNDRYHLDAFLANLKYFRIAQFVLYDKESGERFRFRKILPLSGWKLPRTMYNDSVDSHSWRFFFRIHNWLDANTVRIDLDIKAWGKRPSLTAELDFSAAASPLVTTALQNGLPCYNYKILCPVQGDMVWGGRHIRFQREKTAGILRDSKGFYRYLSSLTWCTAAGFDEEGRRCGFSIAEQPVKEPDENNENAFWLGDVIIPLPPVRITMPQGINEPWIIQDMEGMVDLTFSPKVPARSAFNLAVFSAEYQTPLGIFSGILLNSKGESTQIRNLWGLGERLFLRV